MSNQRAAQALERIERALARIERAAGEAPPPDDGELRRLRETHKALRGKVEGAISQIDRLIAAGGRA
ncbi:MAG TPA: hypothetical protein VGD19_05340 [Allosphingosinicella sp.]|jgi:hypothetical protein